MSSPPTSSATMRYRVHDGDGPPALVIHGFLTGGVYWNENLAALRTVCRPVVIDLWGHDGSPSPAGPDPYRPDGVVAAFEDVRRLVGADRWHVIGHSLGTALALHYALAHPDRTLGLVVTNSNSGFAPAELAPRRAATVERLAAEVEARGMAAFDEHPLNPSNSKRLPDRARAALVAAYDNHDAAGLANTLRWTTPNAGVADRLDEVRVPTLLTWGTYESRFEKGADVARERIPDLRVVRLAGGHPVNLQDPDRFDDAVTRFLGDVSDR